MGFFHRVFRFLVVSLSIPPPPENFDVLTIPTFSNDQSSKSARCLALVEVAVAVAALLHLLDLLLPQLGPLRRPLNNPHEVPAPQLTLQPTPSSLVLPPNRGRVLGFLDRWLLQLRKLRPFLCFMSLSFPTFKFDNVPAIWCHYESRH